MVRSQLAWHVKGATQIRTACEHPSDQYSGVV